MHISDGIIDTGLSAAAFAASVGLVYASGRKVPQEEIPKMGITGAALFVLSLIHVPFAGTSIHPGLYGMAGILLGKRSFPVIFTVLLFQAMILQHGGLLSVGINSLNLGAGAFCAWLIWRQRGLPEYFRAALAGFIGIVIPVLLMALAFHLSGYGRGILYLFSVYIFAALAEGVITLFVVKFFRKTKSDILA